MNNPKPSRVRSSVSLDDVVASLESRVAQLETSLSECSLSEPELHKRVGRFTETSDAQPRS